MKWTSLLQDYLSFLKIERGLSDNSIKSYKLDIEKLIAYLEEFKISSKPENISNTELTEFIYHTSKQVNPRTQSRIISGLKGFFNYLIFEDYRNDNPLETIESPKVGRKLPDTLSV